VVLIYNIYYFIHMKTGTRRIVKVPLGENSYNILIQPGIALKLTGLIKPFKREGKTLILSDANVRRFHPAVFNKLKSAGTCFFFIKPGEASKNLKTIEQILTFMLKNRFDRSSLLVAIGGGVVGDMGGFAASLFMRGIPYIQVPTTLLAQVDSSVGGKTGVNHAMGKNMIGTFCQPRAVFIDPEFLKTLSKKEFLNGFAEVIKHGIIRSGKLFSFLEKNLDRILRRDPAILCSIVADNCSVKAGVVSRDEKEKGLRAILNFGHTFGHAIETLTNYRGYSHGEAVMLGMKAATICAASMDLLKLTDASRILTLLHRAGMPGKARLKPQAVYKSMFSDKKVRGRKLLLILPASVGSVVQVPSPDRDAVLKGVKSIVLP
jgi:3-dehydroquinate synthase